MPRRTPPALHAEADTSAPSPPISFAAIDFETATAERPLVCALGVVLVESGELVNERLWLIRPPGNEHDGSNTALHGIGPSDAAHSDSFPQVWEEVAAFIGESVVVAHDSVFDMSVATCSAEHHGCRLPEISFVWTYRLARSRWPELGTWKLPDMYAALGIDGLKHHEPLSGARSTARLLLAMCAGPPEAI